jgi:hypothetical protein
VKHRFRIALPSILVEFDAAESVQSFSFDYVLLADNVPSEVTGNLNIVVKLAKEVG